MELHLYDVESTLKYKNAITMFYNLKIGSVEFEIVDWFISKKFLQFLEFFCATTVSLSGVF